tara:strand:+ start:60793 stop:61026 length:234 start_codon:yes stop_codon:yes gene_type:complete
MSKCPHGMMAYECTHCAPRRSVNIEVYYRALALFKARRDRLQKEKLDEMKDRFIDESPENYGFNTAVEDAKEIVDES